MDEFNNATCDSKQEQTVVSMWNRTNTEGIVVFFLVGEKKREMYINWVPCIISESQAKIAPMHNN